MWAGGSDVSIPLRNRKIDAEEDNDGSEGYCRKTGQSVLGESLKGDEFRGIR